MKQLWAPWRMPYILARDEDADCLFCRHRDQPPGPENLILHRGSLGFVLLNRYPYTNGHLMVAPNAHQASLEGLSTDELTELMELSRRSLRALRHAYGASAFNLGANIGAASGAGVVGHVHLHVVPRWDGDTNFMATTAGTRVIPEELDETYRRLAQAWQSVE